MCLRLPGLNKPMGCVEVLYRGGYEDGQGGKNSNGEDDL